MTQFKKETVKEVKPEESKDVTAKPVSIVDSKEETLEVKETPVTKDESVKVQEVSGEQILNGGKDALEGNPKDGIDEKSDGAKEMIDTQEKAEKSVKDGSSGLNATGVSEVQNGLVKDFNSDRPVYPTNSAYMAAMSASGKLASED